MKHALSALLVLQVFTAVTLVGFGQEEGESPELSELRSQFERAVIELDKPLAGLKQKYRSYLKDQKTSFQKEGNLKGVLATDNELETFESSSSKELSAFPELKRLKEIYRGQKAEVEKNTLDLKLQLVRGYQKSTADLASEWTKAGNIKKAKLALAESERYAKMEKDASLLSAIKAGSPNGQVNPAIVGRWVQQNGWGAEFLVNGEARNITPKGVADVVGKWENNADGRFSARLGKKGQWKWKISLKGDDLQVETFLNGKRNGKSTYSKRD